MATATVVVKQCKLCHSFLHDHLCVAAHLKFKKRAREATASAEFADAVQDLAKSLATCIAYPEFYETFLSQCKNMEEFQGRAATMDIFFSQQPIFVKLYQHMECMLFDAGLGKLSELGPWIREHVYTVFLELLRMHKEHTKEITATGLGAPLLFQPANPRPNLAKAEKEAVCGRNILKDMMNAEAGLTQGRNLMDDWTEDDLYA